MCRELLHEISYKNHIKYFRVYFFPLTTVIDILCVSITRCKTSTVNTCLCTALVAYNPDSPVPFRSAS